MKNFLKLLSVFKVVSNLVPILAARIHTKADAIGLVCATVTNLVASGHLPADTVDGLDHEAVGAILEAHPSVTFAPEAKTEVLPPVTIPVNNSPSPADDATNDRLTRIENALARLVSTQ